MKSVFIGNFIGNKRKAKFHKKKKKLFGSNEIKSDLCPPFFSQTTYTKRAHEIKITSY